MALRNASSAKQQLLDTTFHGVLQEQLKESLQLFSLREIDRQHLRKSRPSPQFIYISLKLIWEMDQQSVTNCGVNFPYFCEGENSGAAVRTCFHSKENPIKMIGIFRPLAVKLTIQPSLIVGWLQFVRFYKTLWNRRLQESHNWKPFVKWIRS